MNSISRIRCLTITNNQKSHKTDVLFDLITTNKRFLTSYLLNSSTTPIVIDSDNRQTVKKLNHEPFQLNHLGNNFFKRCKFFLVKAIKEKYI